MIVEPAKKSKKNPADFGESKITWKRRRGESRSSGQVGIMVFH
jgi:hypothetical protein